MYSVDLSRICSTLNQFFRAFQKRPFSYLYESDLQADLFSRLRKDCDWEIQVKTNQDFQKRFCPIENIITTAWKTEYPSRVRFDIAAIEDNPYDQTRLPWNQNVKMAIELKYQQCGDKSDLIRARLDGDLEKLASHLGLGVITQLAIALMFSQVEIPNLSDLTEREWVRGMQELACSSQAVVITPTEIWSWRG